MQGQPLGTCNVWAFPHDSLPVVLDLHEAKIFNTAGMYQYYHTRALPRSGQPSLDSEQNPNYPNAILTL